MIDYGLKFNNESNYEMHAKLAIAANTTNVCLYFLSTFCKTI